jgi:cyclohexyl-isocyanide hydratase
MSTKIAFLVFPGITQLDFTGPAQMLAFGGCTVEAVWRDKAPIPTDSGFSIMPTATLEECREADVVCVAGGEGVHDVMDDEAVLCWLRGIARGAGHVTSVCTGSLILAAAGLLEGYRATSHWMWRDYLALFGAVPTNARLVVDRNRITGGGVTCGIDFGLALLGELKGETPAKLAQLGGEYDPHPPFDAGTPERAGPELVAILQKALAKETEWRRARIEAAAARLKAHPLTC